MQTKTRTILYWLTTIFGPASFVIGGVLNLLRTDEVLVNLGHLGYPVYFATILGMWKLLGAITVVLPGLPRLKKLAYAGFFFDLTGAAMSHAFVGDGIGHIVGPLVFLALVVASYQLRPANRR